MQQLRKTAMILLLPVLILGWTANNLHFLWQDHHQSETESQTWSSYSDHPDCYLCDFQPLIPDLAPVFNWKSSPITQTRLQLPLLRALHSQTPNHSFLRGPPTNNFG